ncbi:MAG TPA: hypothetical protein VKQ32_04940 [Polyangia bacterium]|nr:hypothetical protein [Polyangia bacterium]
MRVMNLSWCKFALAIVLAAGACGSSSPGGKDASAGSSGGGTTGAGGTTGSAGTMDVGGTSGTGRGGTTGSAGTTGRGGTTGAGGTAGGAGTAGTQPIGSACVNDANCSQADGTAVCCLQINTCVLQSQCPTGTNYVPCTTNASCNKGGWICCTAGGMSFCTKQSACP